MTNAPHAIVCGAFFGALKTQRSRCESSGFNERLSKNDSSFSRIRAAGELEGARPASSQIQHRQKFVESHGLLANFFFCAAKVVAICASKEAAAKAAASLRERKKREKGKTRGEWYIHVFVCFWCNNTMEPVHCKILFFVRIITIKL